MKVSIKLILLAMAMSGYVNAQQLAFPTAEGYGRYAIGGRNGEVVEVTNLKDSGPGSLRHACLNVSGPRTIVFRVGGIIELNSKIEIKGQSHITIAGQTAPGDGICLKNYPLFINESEHIIVRYIRSRLGDQGNSDADAVSVRSCTNVMIDHCSMSWSIDDILDVTHQSGRITVQWCILSEALDNSHHEKGAHGYAAGWDGKNGATYHHNIIAHCSSRTPRLDKYAADDGTRDDLIDIINNVIYNWSSYGAYGGENADVNWMNNYYRYGPNTSGWRSQIFKPDGDCKVHVSGNFMFDYPDVTADNTLGIREPQKPLDSVVVEEPFETWDIHMQSAKEAFKLVLANAGTIHPTRDTVDRRVVQDILNGTGDMIDSQEEVGGWPEYANGNAPTDTDQDGMPDDWEDGHGLDKNDASDRNDDADDDGYTNLEEYLNSLVGDNTANDIEVPEPEEEEEEEIILGKQATSSSNGLDCFPNPFTDNITMKFDLDQSAFVALNVFDLKGTQVAELVNGSLPEGGHEVSWQGDGLDKGIYVVQLITNATTTTQKISLK